MNQTQIGLVRGTIGETHPSLVKRRGMKQTEVPISTKPHLATGVQAARRKDERRTWNEAGPSPKSNATTLSISMLYESDRTHHDDDTPGGARLLTSNIYWNIHRDTSRGDKVVKGC